MARVLVSLSFDPSLNPVGNLINNLRKIDKKDNPAATASSRSKDDAEQRDQIGHYFQKIFGNKFRCKSSPNIWQLLDNF